jgi:hypothetical protein
MTRHETFGKYFTEVVSKTPLQVIIQCLDTRIQGTIHLHPANRLSDEVNEEDMFLPVTDARMIKDDEELEAGFVSVNKQHILWIVPADDLEAVDD